MWRYDTSRGTGWHVGALSWLMFALIALRTSEYGQAAGKIFPYMPVSLEQRFPNRCRTPQRPQSKELVGSGLRIPAGLSRHRGTTDGESRTTTEPLQSPFVEPVVNSKLP